MTSKHDFFGITTITAHNERERDLVAILTNSFRTIAEYYMDTDPDNLVAASVRRDRSRHWLITELRAQLSAAYFMGLMPEPVSSSEVWEVVREYAAQAA